MQPTQKAVGIRESIEVILLPGLPERAPGDGIGHIPVIMEPAQHMIILEPACYAGTQPPPVSPF
jgi:hypothetical protein